MSWFRPKPDLSQYPEIPIRRSPPSLSADSGRQSFREMLEAMTAALRATPGVTVDEEVYNPPCSPQTLHAAAEGLKENAHVELCEGFLAFYSEMDGCSVKWSAPAEGQAVRGAIIITPMATALANFREAPEYGCYQHMVQARGRGQRGLREADQQRDDPIRAPGLVTTTSEIDFVGAVFALYASSHRRCISQSDRNRHRCCSILMTFAFRCC